MGVLRLCFYYRVPKKERKGPCTEAEVIMGSRLAVFSGALCTRETASTQVRLALQFCLCFRIRSREVKK